MLFSQGSVAGKLQLTEVRRVYKGTVGEQNFFFNDQDISGKNFGFLFFPDNERVLSDCIGYRYYYYFFSPGATTPLGVVFYSPLAGFSLLAYEVS